VKQHLGRQSGVQKVDVSLIDGKVDVTPRKMAGLIPFGSSKRFTTVV